MNNLEALAMRKAEGAYFDNETFSLRALRSACKLSSLHFLDGEGSFPFFPSSSLRSRASRSRSRISRVVSAFEVFCRLRVVALMPLKVMEGAVLFKVIQFDFRGRSWDLWNPQVVQIQE